MNKQEIEKLQESVCMANLSLHEKGLIICTWGNVSGIDRVDGVVGIKPSGIPYEQLEPHLIVLVDLSGKVIAGDLRPSSDLPTHLELYRQFPQIGGIAHTHSIHATAFAQAVLPLPCLGTTHADHFYGPVPVTRPMLETETAAHYELNTGRIVVETFTAGGIDPAQVPAVLVAQHGPFTWGSSAAEAVTNSVVLEAVAEMALQTFQLTTAFTAIDRHLLDKHFLRKHGRNAYYGQL